MRILVTGATGFLGANVVRAHLARGDRVRCLVRASSPTLAIDGLDVERVEAPLSDVAALEHALQDCDAIQHVAGLFDASPRGHARMEAVHVEGTRNLVEAARRVGVRRMVLCSSSITVGYGDHLEPGDEESPIPDLAARLPPGSATAAYQATKLRAEQIARDALAFGVEVPIVNPDYVIGPWDVKPTSGTMIVQMARAPIPFYPLGGKCFIDAGDCAMGHLLALDHGRPGRRYLLGNENLAYREFMALVARVVGCPPPLLPMPRHAVRAIGAFGALYARLNPHGAAGFDASILTGMQEKRFRSGARARDELGLPWTPIASSIETAWHWFVEHGYASVRPWNRLMRRFA